MNEYLLESVCSAGGIHLVEGVRIRNIELTDASATQRFQVSAAPGELTHVMGDRTHVGARSNSRAEGCAVGFNVQDIEFLHFHLYGIELNRLLLASEFVCGNALELLGRKRWRHLLDDPAELRSPSAHLLFVQRNE